MTTKTTDIAVVTEQAVNMATTLHIGATFTSEALLTEDRYSIRRCTWLTGNNQQFSADGKQPLAPARGFYIDKPDESEMSPEDYELADAMELLCASKKAREVQVEHLDENRRPHRVPCWHLPLLSLFVVCEGVPGKQMMDKDPSFRLGVAYTGFRGSDANGKMLPSEVHFSAFIKELMDVGYCGAFMFKFSSFIVPKALDCLRSHEYTLRFVNALRADAGESQGLPYYACALPITCSTKTITAGKEVGKTREVYYPVAVIPRLSRNTPVESMAFLASVAITQEQAAILEENGRVSLTAQWSVDFTKRLIAGNVVDEAIVPDAPVDDTPPFTDADIPEGLR